MTVRHMKVFLAVCESGNNTTKAAERLNMTQPAVSLAISELERYYGVQLFDRIARRLYITEAGKAFQEYALRISSLFDDMEKGLRNWDSFGVLRVGGSITIGSQFMPSYVEAYSTAYPEVDVRVEIGPSDQIERHLMSNELDLALIEGVVHSENLIAEEYMEDSLVIIAPAKAPFQPGRTLTMDEFRKQRFLLREFGSGTRDLFDHVIHAAGFSITPVWEAMSTTALVNAVIRGLGIAVLPTRMVSGPIKKGLVHALSVQGLEFKRHFSVVHHKDKFLTPFAKAFIELCKNYELDYPLPKYNDLF